MNKFITSEMVKKELEAEIEFAEKNGSIDAYEEVPGKQAFREGVYQGVNNSYVRAVADVKRYLKDIMESNSDAKISDIVSKIVYK